MKHSSTAILALTTAAILCGAMLSACGQTASQTPAGQQPMTQPIVNEQAPTQPEEESQSSPNTSSQQAAAQPVPGESAQAQPSSLPQDLTYYQAEALEKVAYLDIEQLEIDYRMGQLGEEEFLQKKQQLRQEKQTYDDLADLLEYSLPLYSPTQEEDACRDISQLLEWYREAEIAEEMEEHNWDKLSMDYQSGAITREELVDQLAQQQEREYQAEQRADWLEDRLELLGWDD